MITILILFLSKRTMKPTLALMLFSKKKLKAFLKKKRKVVKKELIIKNMNIVCRNGLRD